MRARTDYGGSLIVIVFVEALEPTLRKMAGLALLVA